MKRRRIAAFAAALIVILCSCSANDTSNKPDNQQSNTSSTETLEIALPFSATDPLNPYVAVTEVNQHLSLLMYDPLIKLSADFEPVGCLAETVEYAEKTLTVTLKKGVTFTDGSALTAGDVVYSIKQALNSESKYKTQLSAVKSYSASDSMTVVITLTENDPYFANALDFPIFKSGTAETKDIDDRIVPPIGCGRYTFDKTDGYKLTANKNYHGTAPRYSYIELIDTPDDESLIYTTGVGGLDMAYSDLSDNSVPKMSGAKSKICLTNFVFLGLNLKNRLLSKADFRMALSDAISRNDICTSAYFNFADPANGIYPPSWAQAGEFQHIDAEQNIEQAVAYLEQLGYNSKDADGYLTDKSGQRLTLRLIYNEENSSRKYAAKLIVQHLKKVGIDVKAEGIASFEEYQSLVRSSSYDMYIGEIKLGKSLDLRPVFSSDSADSLTGTLTAEAVNTFYNGESDLSTIVSCFSSEMPLVPLCYRSGVVVCSDKINNLGESCISDIYACL